MRNVLSTAVICKHGLVEAPFVLLAGPVWRPDLIVAPLVSFKRRRNLFIKRLCTKWAIPSTLSEYASPAHVEPPPDSGEFRVSPLSPISGLTLPDALGWDAHWNSDCNQLEFVTDNETLASILNGRAQVKSNEHEHVLRSSINYLERLYACTFVPRYWVLAPALWRPRQHNKLADGLVNCAMNHKRDAEGQSSARGHGYFSSCH